jgi:hypothetical protein
MYRRKQISIDALSRSVETNSFLSRLEQVKKFYMETQEIGHDTKLEEFLRWLKEKGASFQNLQFVKFSSEGRGFVATEDFAKNQRLCTVPMELVITERKIRESEIGKILSDLRLHEVVEDKYLGSYLFLIGEKQKGKKSFWYPYINILPSSESTPLM